MTMFMVHYRTMIVVNIHEAKAKLSEYLEAAAGGQRVLICRRNQPVAELRAVAPSPTEPRPVGLARHRLVVPDAFFEPLPADVLAAFEGEVEPRRAEAAARAADRPDVLGGPGRPRGRRSAPRRRR